MPPMLKCLLRLGVAGWLCVALFAAPAEAYSTNTSGTTLNGVLEAQTDTNTALGVPGDSAWSGSGSGAVIAILKKIAGGAVSSLPSQGYTSAATITRPANTTAYTANDVLGGAITFTAAGPSAGGDLIVTSVELEADIAAIPSGMTSFSLYLYNVTPPSAIADNAAFDIPSGDRASFLGKIALGTPVDEGSTLYIRTDQVNAHLKVASGGSLFGYVVTAGAFTPAGNSEVYKVTLHGVAP